MPSRPNANQISCDAGLDRVPTEQQGRQQARGEHVALASKDDAGNQSEIVSTPGAQDTQSADIAEHDQIADDHGGERILEAHADHKHRSGHRPGDGHWEPDPYHREREHAPSRRERYRFVLVLFAQDVIELLLDLLQLSPSRS